ncbi:MAG: helix-turn-helix domain-containing protein, partial [Pseudonocardiaceae bacterium]
FVDVEDARTIGRRLRQIRKSRKKSLVVIAGLAGMSKSQLDRIERGEVALDKLSEIVALANALQIAPSELMRLPVPAPANGDTDAAVEAVRSAVTAASRDRPGGLVLPVAVLRDQVSATLNAHYGCQPGGEVGATLPGLIRDLHTSIVAGRDVAELLDLAVLLHAGATVGWLRVAGAGLDLRSEASLLALRAAQDRDTPTALGLATWGGVYVMVTKGEFDLAQAELDAVTVPTNTPESIQLAGTLALCRSYVASADSRPGDMDAPLGLAAELAERIGGGSNAYSLGFGLHAVGQWHMAAAREAGDHERVVSIAEALRPDVHFDRSREADYWVDYGGALSRLRGRSDDAVLAFRRAEVISLHHVHRNPLVREALAGLLARSRRDSPAGRKLRRMAYRAGLPV